ncbi:RNA polymerase sigma-70 factor [Parapedobacter lycopersici]|uniref:RNA polymerase sigma-70 factor n=1 Tax=Parapedobacter lycopersici TaxID=1864939 RepID=UPI00214D265A|nr:RNA polymerase sigma-70 factor [Parapedobacter lycopersici]
MLSVEKLFKEYYTRLCHFAWQLLNDKDAAEDVVQDAFMVYWNNRETIIDNDVAIKNFLYAAVRNACYNVVRREKVTQRFQLLHQIEELEESQVLANIIRSEVMVEIYGIMQSMPAGCQEVFRLGYLEGLSNTEIAEQLDISVNTVKTQKQRGLKLVKGKLNPELFTLLLLFLVGK